MVVVTAVRDRQQGKHQNVEKVGTAVQLIDWPAMLP